MGAEEVNVEAAATNNRSKTMELEAQWEFDCGGKQDFDATLVRLSSRFWPQGGGYYEWNAGQWLENKDRPKIPPSAKATIYLQDRELASASFEGHTETEVKAKLEAWAREQFSKVANALSVAFPPTAT